MASANTLCKNLLNVKHAIITGHDFYHDSNGVQHLRIKARPRMNRLNNCPICHKACQGYDQPSKKPRIWRALDWGSTLVEIEYCTRRINCPDHGVLVADVPWAYPNSGFTRSFDLTAAWLATYLPRSVVSEYMRIDWETVGNCIHRATNDIEPDRRRRLDGLVNIGIDETSYKKGHKYITVIVNHDTNTVVWAAQGHGKGALKQFYETLTPEQLSSIKVVTGDGAKWITECVNEYTPNCERCVDPFHVVQWAMDALNEVRKEAWRIAHTEAKVMAEKHPQKPGRPGKNNQEAARLSAARKKAEEIKNSSYALGKAPENLTKNQALKLELIASENKQLYRAYFLKEKLRLLLKIKNVDEAEAELKRWLWRASHSRISAICDLCRKIRRHKEHIMNTIRLSMSNARIEATNNKIKLIIRKAYGFRNITNMLDMVYLVCSNLRIPLPNRKATVAKAA